MIILPLMLLLPLSVFSIRVSQNCFDNKQFVFLDGPIGDESGERPFSVERNAAAELCQSLVPQGELPLITSRQENNFIKSFSNSIADRNSTNRNFWLGFERTNSTTDPASPLSYGVNVSTFGSNPFRDPWALDEPNPDLIESGDCVRMSVPENTWVIRDCFDDNTPMCVRPCVEFFSECSEEETMQYIRLPEVLTYDEAVQSCSSFGARVARPLSEEEYFVLDNFTRAIDTENNYWLRYRRTDLSSSVNDPLNYGVQEGTFGSQAREFPWDESNPRRGQNQCVQAILPEFFWTTANCGSSKTVICERSCSAKSSISTFVFLSLFVFVLSVLMVFIFLLGTSMKTLKKVNLLLRQMQMGNEFNQSAYLKETDKLDIDWDSRI